MAFIILGVEATLGERCGNLEHLNSFREMGNEMSPGLSLRLYRWVLKPLRLSTLAVEHSVVVMLQVSNQDDPRLNPMGSQFSILILLNFCSEVAGK